MGRGAKRAINAGGLRRSRIERRLRAGSVEGREATPAKPSVLPPPPPRVPAPVATVEPPDLLHIERAISIDERALQQTLDFAFAGGDVGDALSRVLDDTVESPTGWSPACFSSDLFVDELIESCFRFKIAGRPAPLHHANLVMALTNAPSDRAVVEFRRDMLRALTDEAPLREAFIDLYRRLCHLRQQFIHEEPAPRSEHTRRRIDALGALRDVIDVMAEGFGDTSSGLARIAEMGNQVRETDAYARLVDLLQFDENMAAVDVHLQVGADGRVRKFELMRLEENRTNRFYQSPIARLFIRIMVWARGYRFSEDELVDRWLDAVFTDLAHLMPALFQLIGHIEFYLAALSFRDMCQAKGLDVCFPDLVDDGGRDVKGLFNPLLFSQGINPVPCDLVSDDFDSMTIVTGPNSGGKTRLLQAVGLLQMLAQAGFYAPAASARLRWAPGLFVSLIQETKADQREGRLGTELMRIRQLFEQTRPGALIVLDELCSGTNPSEGQEIFMLVVGLLRELRSEVFITTHFLQFAGKLSADADNLGLAFLQVALDDAQHPTFKFTPGVATTSLATQTAARLGVTREELITLIKRHD